ncbi:MAG: hypothetical protein HN403_04455 [Rhodospirillales bacterium]|jgi:hypothetical protein|nr:hypothetical protein [Rhodospirillales bacterium]
MDASKRISDLIIISKRLAELLIQENTALRDHRTGDVQALINEKDETSRVYESRIVGLSEHATDEDIAEVDEILMDQLRFLSKEIQALSEENAMRLQVAMEANRRVLHEVTEAVKANTPGPGTYSNSGVVSKGPSQAAPGNIPISLDKLL